MVYNDFMDPVVLVFNTHECRNWLLGPVQQKIKILFVSVEVRTARGSAGDLRLTVSALPSKVMLVCLPGPRALVLSLAGKVVRKLTTWLRFF